MITVIVFLQQSTSFGIIYAQFIGKRMNVLVKVLVKLRITDTTNFCILIHHGYITQVIQITEHAHLTELRHARQHGKMNEAVTRLERAIECFERVTEFCLQFRICDGLQHRFVVLIYQNHHLLPHFLRSPTNNSFKTGRHGILIRVVAILCFPLLQRQFQLVFQTCFRIILFRIQIHVKHRMHRPVLFQTFHGKPLEKFTLSQKISFQSRNHQTLTEPSRAAQKIVLACLHQVI